MNRGILDRVRITAVILCVWLCNASHAQELKYAYADSTWEMPDRLFVVADDLPNPMIYIPAPVDTASAAFSRDFLKWQWGKVIRQNPNGTRTQRGTYAYNDAQYGLNRWCNILTTIIKTSVTSNLTPKVVYLIYNAGESGSVSTQFAKLGYMRRRPVSQMNETAWGRNEVTEDLLTSGSFPSSHAAFGWAVGLAFAEIMPELQDTLMARAYTYGENRTIVGAHWMSDVEAAFLTASAAVAHIHTLDTFKAAMLAAQNEYYTIKGTSPNYNVGLPDGNRIQQHSAIDTTSEYYFSDVQGYWQAKAERETVRGDTAIIDSDDSEHALLQMFGDIMNDKLVISVKPNTVELIRMTRAAFIESAQQMGAGSPFRKRPYVQLGEPTLIPDHEQYYADKTSYPSTKAMIGWGLALLLSEIAPEYNEALLKRGYDYGHSRVIAGYNYPSDVMAGRIQAAAVLAYLHGQEEFKQLMEAAKQEHIDPMYIVTEVSDIISDKSSSGDDMWFTATGIRLHGRPTVPGIYIHGNKKVVVRLDD
ncbi:MAG: phosphatase PAP2 family protein [Muribaculaceae bacterium]|nr:phosphatase PAP2 family protein [Muribaculaceae bacterium]